MKRILQLICYCLPVLGISQTTIQTEAQINSQTNARQWPLPPYSNNIVYTFLHNPNIVATSTLLPGYIPYAISTRTLSNSPFFTDGTNVGIGTTSLTSTFNITGSLKYVDGNQGAGKILISNSSGIASWSTHSVSVVSQNTVTIGTVGSATITGAYPNFTLSVSNSAAAPTWTLSGNDQYNTNSGKTEVVGDLQVDGTYITDSNIDPVINPLEGKLYYDPSQGGLYSFNFKYGDLYAPNGNQSIVLSTYGLQANGNTISLNWDDRILWGVWTATTMPQSDNSTALANTHFVRSVISSSVTTVHAGTGTAVTSNNPNSYTVTNTAPDQTVTFSSVGNNTVTGTYPTFTLTTPSDNASFTNGAGYITNTVTSGATGITSYTIGDLITASTSTTLSTIHDVAAGSYFRSGGVATIPLWSTLTLPNSATANRIAFASATDALNFSANMTFATPAFNVSVSTNAETSVNCINSNGGAAAYAAVFADNNTNSTSMRMYGTAFTTNGLLKANLATLFASTSASGLLILTGGGDIKLGVGVSTSTVSEMARITSVGLGLKRVGDPTAILHLGKGNAAASSAPLKFSVSTATLMATAEVGAVEPFADNLFYTINTGTQRVPIALVNATLTSGIYPVATTNGRLTDGAMTTTNLLSGTYTPTLTLTANLDAATAVLLAYSRLGNLVTVVGSVSIDPTTTLTDTQLSFSLPIGSDFTGTGDCAGGSAYSTQIAAQGAGFVSDATNDRMIMEWKAVDVTNQVMSFTFGYLVK